MNLNPICIGMVRAGIGAWTPSWLFAAGTNGAYYDYSGIDPGLIFFQDFAMTPASDPSDPVRVALDRNSLGKQKTAFLDGVSGTYFSTPDSAALDITGDIDVRVNAMLVDWAPSGGRALASKGNNAAQNAWLFYVKANRRLAWNHINNGVSAVGEAESTADVPVANGSPLWVRVTLDVDNGAGGRDYTFYTSTDGSAWTQLGTTVNVAGTTSLTPNNQPLTFGQFDGASIDGRMYRAQVYDGIDGTLVADFNPADYSGSGSTLVSSTTGETYTRNGSAYIAGDGYHLVAPNDAARSQLARVPRGGVRNELNGSDTLATQNVTVSAAERTLSFKGTGTVTLSGVSTAGPLVGTGVADTVSLTFTPTAGTLTLTVSGSVTEAQLELGAARTAYQSRTDATLVTQSGVPSVTCKYHAGSQYDVIQGSKNWTFMHDGTGGYYVGGVAVNKADDGADDYFWSSRVTGTNVGSALALLDSGANAGKAALYVANGTSDILGISSADSAVSRYTPIVVSTSYADADTPDGSVRIDGTSVASGNDTGTPSVAAATYDIAVFAGGDGNNIMPCYDFGCVFVDSISSTQLGQAETYYTNLTGA